MKHLTFIVITLFCFKVQAQTQHHLLISGTTDLSAFFTNEKRSYAGQELYTTKRSQLNLKPSIGYLITQNWAAGMFVYANYQRNGGQKQSMIAFGPMSRYYLGSGIIRPFVYGELGIAYPRFKYEDAQGTRERFTGAVYGLDLGSSFFINEVLAIDAMIGYDGASLKFEEDSRYKIKRNGLSFNIGLSIRL